MTWYIGIDGGGTKTAFALSDEYGQVLGTCTLGSASHKQVGLDGVAKVISEGIDQLLSSRKAEDIAVCMGVPSFGESTYYDAQLKKTIARTLAGMSVQLVNDSEVAWAGSLLLEEGINIVAGTGSIAYGKNREGRVKSAGGWSEWFSDEGSCRWLGVKSMELFSKEADGRLKKGALYELVCEHFALEKDIDIIDIFEREYLPFRDKTASLQRILMEAALQGDKAAGDAYKEAAKELAMILKAEYRGLGFTGRCPVSYSGGLFKSGN